LEVTSSKNDYLSKRINKNKAIGWLNSLIFTNDDKYLIWGFNKYTENLSEGIIEVWDLKRDLSVYRIKAHKDSINGLIFWKEKELIISGSWDHMIKIWDFNSSKLVQSHPIDHKIRTLYQSLHSNSSIFIGCEDALFLWDLERNKIVKEYPVNKFGAYSISQTHNYLSRSGASPCPVQLFNVETMEIVYSFTTKYKNAYTSGGVFFSPDGKYLVSGEYDDQEEPIKIWDIEDKTLYKMIGVRENLWEITQITLTKNGRYLFVCTFRGKIWIYKFPIGILLCSIKPDNLEDVFEISNSEEYIVTDTEDSILIWNLKKIIMDAENILENNIIKILEFENEKGVKLSRTKIEEILMIDYNEAERIQEYLDAIIEYKDEEVDEIKILAEQVIKSNKNPTLYDIVITCGFNYEIAKKIGKYLLDTGKLDHFNRISLKEIIVFISYASKDAERYKIKEIAELLTKFEDIKDAKYWEEDSHDNIVKYMNEMLGICDIMLLFCSSKALKSIPVEKEWTAADVINKPIIPIFENLDDIPNLLRTRRGIQFEGENLAKTVREIHHLILKKLTDED